MLGLNQTQILSRLRDSAEHQMRRVWQTLPPERRKQVRKTLHPAVVAQATRAVTTAPQVVPSKPQVAVVVVASNGGQNSAATLRSVIGQKPSALEIIVVDTTEDRAAEETVQGYATRDARVVYVAEPTLSVNAARELGIARTRAPYLFLLMAGDMVEKGSIDSAFRSLKSTDSDFAVGAAGLPRGKKFAVPAFQRDLHGQPRPALALTELPEILQDGFLANKLFTRGFWERELAGVPSSTRYWQHQLVQTAYLRAVAFDVLAVKICNTKDDDGAAGLVREEICQLADLQKRLARTHALETAYAQHASAELYAQWLTREVSYGLFPYFEVVPRTDEAYWNALRDSVQRYAETSAILWQQVRLHNRLILAMVLADSREDVIRICVSRSDYGSSFPTALEQGGLRAAPPYLADLTAPFDHSLLACQPVDLTLVSVLNHYQWCDNGMLEIGGYAYISSLDPAAGSLTIEAALVNNSGDVVLNLDLTRENDPQIDWDANDNWTSYASSAFRTVIDPSLLFNNAALSGDQNWHVRMTLKAHDRTVQGIITKRDLTGSTGGMPAGATMDGQRIAAEMKPVTGLTFIRVTPMYTAKALSLSGRRLRMTVEAHSAPLAAKIVVECPKLGLRRTATCISVSGNVAEYAITLPALGPKAVPRTEYQWQLRLDSGFKSPQPVAWEQDTPALEVASDPTRRLRVKLTGYGFLALEEQKFRVAATTISVSEDQRVLTVYGTADFISIHAPRFVLSSGKAVIPAAEVSLDVRTNAGSNAFEAQFILPVRPWSSEELMPESGAYSLRYVPANSDDALGYWIPVNRELQEQLPARLSAGRLEIGVSRSAVAGALTIHLRPPLAPDELGRYNQQQLRRQSADEQVRPLRNAALFMCFGGARATDSPRRLYEEFRRRGTTWPVYWAIRDYSVPVPNGAIPVLIGSRTWYEVLSEARILINNNNFPFYFRKREGQTYVQTWHGTPLKKLGNDVARTNFSLSYWNLMWREAGYWDALLAQNDYAAEVLAKCFGFEGRVIAEGYPRNDSLSADDLETVRPGLRERLGIPEGKIAILYAPTWRDDAKNASRQYELVTYLDFEKAQKLLGDDYVLLLRGHHNIAGQRQTAANKFVIDVTEYPEVNELYIAADILVNDYSSVMFDFAVTGKPILFLTPDIAQYRDSTRGFYFDLEELAPGPLLETTEEVVKAIRNISTVQRRYTDKYARFVSTFAPNCDGNATERVFEALWAEQLGSTEGPISPS